MNSTQSIIMRPRQAGKTHEAAAKMAAGRTAYSLAREVLGLRAQVDELRTLADDAEILRRSYHRCCEEISELKAALVEEGEPVPTGPAVALVHRLKAERAQLRDTLANMEAEEGKEITALEQEIEAANDIASDIATRLDLVRQALGVPVEPHQGIDERLLEAAEGIKAERDELRAKFEAIGQLCPTDYEDREDLLGALLKIHRGEAEVAKGKAPALEGYQPRAEAQEIANPPAAR